MPLTHRTREIPDKEEIDEKTRAALRRIGKVGSAVRWGYLSPSETESEVDEEMHEAMSRIGKKGAAARWRKSHEEVPEQLMRHSKRRREPVEETESETESEEEETELEARMRLRREAAAKLRRRRRREEMKAREVPVRKRRVLY